MDDGLAAYMNCNEKKHTTACHKRPTVSGEACDAKNTEALAPRSQTAGGGGRGTPTQDHIASVVQHARSPYVGLSGSPLASCEGRSSQQVMRPGRKPDPGPAGAGSRCSTYTLIEPRPGCNGAQWSPGVRQQQPRRALLEDTPGFSHDQQCLGPRPGG
jgi:hypothetical protein